MTKKLKSSVCPAKTCKDWQVCLDKTGDKGHCCPIHETPTPALDLSWLLTCRRIYNEANEIPYKKNVFAFDDIDTLKVFSRRAARRIAQVKYLSVSSSLPYKEGLGPLGNTVGSISSAFPNLRAISLAFHGSYGSYGERNPNFTPKYMIYKSPKTIEMGMLNMRRKAPLDVFLQSIIELRKLPLENASLALSGLWEENERRIWCDFIKKTLVEPFDP